MPTAPTQMEVSHVLANQVLRIHGVQVFLGVRNQEHLVLVRNNPKILLIYFDYVIDFTTEMATSPLKCVNIFVSLTCINVNGDMSTICTLCPQHIKRGQSFLVLKSVAGYKLDI